MKIFGEAHFEQASVSAIEKAIRELKPKYIVHELLDDHVLSPDQVEVAFRNAGKSNSPCDPETNIDLFRLALDLNAWLVGCDLSDKEKRDLKSQPLFKQFAKREIRMLEVIHEYADKRDAVAVVGDIHLRRTYNRTMGPSPIYTSWEKDRLQVEIIRAPEQFQEMP